MKGINWVFNELQSVINIFYETEELRGGGSLERLPLYPTTTLLNIQNDNKCFLGSTLAHLYPAEEDPLG